MKNLAGAYLRACIAATLCAVTFAAHGQEAQPSDEPEATAPLAARAAVEAAPPVQLSFDKLAIPASKVFEVANAAATTGEYIVVFKQDEEVLRDARPSDLAKLSTRGMLPNNPSALNEVASGLAKQHGGAVRSVHDGLFRGFSVAAAKADVIELAKDPRVKFVQAALIYKTTASAPPEPPFRQFPSTEAFWHLDRIDQAALPLDYKYHFYPIGGARVHVSILDTGVRTNLAEFGGRLGGEVADCVMPGPQPFCSDDSSENPTRPFIRDPQFQDCNGHGTRVASLIHGITSGVASLGNVQKHAYIVGYSANYGNLCANPGNTTHIMNALNHIVHAADAGASRPHVVNMSVSADSADPLVEGGIQAMVGMGYTFVVGAGNDSSNACALSPARLGTIDGVITVAGMNVRNQATTNSNYGDCVDILAPGEDVRTVDFNGPSSRDGTSYATPIVTGVAALYLASNGNRSPAAVELAIKNAAYMNQLIPGSLCKGPQGRSCSPNRLVSVWVPGYMPIIRKVQPAIQMILEND